MQSAASERQDVDNRASPPAERDAIVHLSSMLRLMLFLGLGLILLGSVIGLIRDGRLPTETINLTSIPGQVVRLHQDGILTLGILTFLVSPAIVLVYLCVSFFRVRQLVFAGVSAIVFGIIIASFVIAQFS